MELVSVSTQLCVVARVSNVLDPFSGPPCVTWSRRSDTAGVHVRPRATVNKQAKDKTITQPRTETLSQQTDMTKRGHDAYVQHRHRLTFTNLAVQSASFRCPPAMSSESWPGQQLEVPKGGLREPQTALSAPAASRWRQTLICAVVPRRGLRRHPPGSVLRARDLC